MNGLTDTETMVLAVVAMKDKGTHTPESVARILRNEQGHPFATMRIVASTAKRLASLGLVRRVKLPRMTYYEITPDGRTALEESCPAT